MSSLTRARSATASAPAKAILLGEHAVNRGQPAIAAAIGLRATVELRERIAGGFEIRSGDRGQELTREELHAFGARIDELRTNTNIEDLASLAANDFFAPLWYVLARLDRLIALPPFEVTIRSEIPIGAGLGSGAAVSAALSLAAAATADAGIGEEAVAELAAAGDAIAHGGVASGLDATASALGGVIRYTSEGGGRRVPTAKSLTLVIGDTSLAASTASVNAGVRRRLAGSPALAEVFIEIGLLAKEAVEAIESGDLERLGRLLDLNQLLLERIGVSCPEIEALVAAAREAGALGAKLSGSGGGGIVVALAEPAAAAAVANAIESAGGEAIVATVSHEGARVEPPHSEQPEIRRGEPCRQK